MFRRFARAAPGALLVLLLVAATASAHAELDSASPAPDATTDGPPATVVAVFTEPLDEARSRLLLFDADGERVAEGGVDRDDPDSLTMIADPPPLAPGVYEVRWTAVTPDDGEVERGRYRFTVEGPGTSASPTPATTAGPVTTATAAGSATAATPTPDVSEPPAPTASPAGPGAPPIGAADDSALLPLAGLGFVAALGAVLLLRRRSR